MNITTTVKSYEEIVSLVNEHGNTMGDWELLPWGFEYTPADFICRVYCKDGVTIDFYGIDESTANYIYNQTF